MTKKTFKGSADAVAMKYLTPDTQSTQTTQEKQHAPRINMAFRGGNLDHLRIMARIDGVSITEYLNRLVEADAVTQSAKVQQFMKVLNQNV